MTTIGIDFGTTNSCAAVWTPQGERIIDMVDGRDTLPSVVALTPKGVLVGRPALRQVHENPAYTFRHVKRYLARPFSENEHHSNQMEKGPDGKIWWKGPDRLWSGPELVAEILKGLLVAAEDSLGFRPTSAVLTVPVGFHDPQKDALRKAGKLAGLETVQFCEEPVAAAAPYHLEHGEFARALVYDWGGGTFDVSVLHVGKGGASERAHGGLADVGGADIDQLIVSHCAEILARDGHDIMGKPHNLARLQLASEEAKIALSTEDEARIHLDNFLMLPTGVAEFKHILTQDQLEELAFHLVRDTLEECRKVLDRANLRRNEVKHIILVGGQTRMPMVHDAIEKMFGKKPLSGVRPEHAVALGAAIKGAQIDGRLPPTSLSRISTASIGIRRDNDMVVVAVPKGRKLPAEMAFELTNSEAGQGVCTVQVYEGEAGNALLNSLVTVWHEPIESSEALDVTVPIVLGRTEEGGIFLKVRDRQVYPEVTE